MAEAAPPALMPPGGLSAVAVPEALQPVLSLLTHGLHVHGARIEELSAHCARLEAAHAAQQAALGTAREASDEAAERARRAEVRAEAAVDAGSSRLSALETRLDRIEARLDARKAQYEEGPASMHELVGELSRRTSQLESASASTLAQLPLAAREASDAREAVLALRERFADAASASDLRALERRVSEVHTPQIGFSAQQLAPPPPTPAPQPPPPPPAPTAEDMARLREKLYEVQRAVDSKAATDDLESRLSRYASHQEVEHAIESARLSNAVALSKLEAQAGAGKDEAAQQRAAVQRCEAAVSSLGDAVSALRISAAESADSRAMRESVSAEVGAQLSALSGEMSRSLDTKAPARQTDETLRAMRDAHDELDRRHRALTTDMHVQSAAAEQAATEAAAATLQVRAATRSIDRLRKEVEGKLSANSSANSGPSRAELEDMIAAALAAMPTRAVPAAPADAPPPSTPTAAPLAPRPTTLAAFTLRSGGADTPTRAEPLADDDDIEPSAPSHADGGAAALALTSRLDEVEAAAASLGRNAAEAAEAARDAATLKERVSTLTSTCERLRHDLEEVREAFGQHLRDQAGLLRPLWSEMQLGRWVWKSGRLRGGHGGAVPTVPWSHERVNAAPENYGWAKDRQHIEVSLPGLYLVSASFFAASCPAVSLIVNGTTVIRRVATKRAVGAESIGLVAGATVRDFISIPANAHVAVGFDAYGATAADAQGFLELRKL